MSAISLKSITGITSITTPAGVDNQLTLHTNNTTERFKIDEAGNVRVANTFDCVGVSTFRNNLFAQADLRIAGEIVHISDSDTRIQFPSNDTIAFKTANSERLRITSDGRIGINDSTPNDYELDILKRDAATDAQIRLYNNGTASSNDTIMRYQIGGTTANNYIYFGDSADTNVGQIRYSHTSNFLSITTNAAERLRITSTGDILTGALTSRSFENDSTNQTILEVTGGGSVGNYGVLNISGNTNSSTPVGRITFVNRENSAATSTSNAGSKALGYIDVYAETSDSNAGDDSGGYMRFATKPESGGSAERLRIKSDGTVFTVTQNKRFGIGQDPDATTMGATSGTWQVPEVDGQTIGSELRLGDINTNSTAVIRLASYGSGDNGTGGGAIMFTNTRNGSNSHHSDIAAIKGARESLGKGYLRFFTANQGANTERLRIKANGYVGINTNNPGAPLHIESHEAGLSIRRNGQYLLFDGNSGNGGDQSISSSAGFRVQTGGVGNSYERFRIDSSGRVLMGTTTAGTGSGDDLTISNSGNMGLTLRSTSSNYCNIYFSDATSGTATYEGYISYNHATDSLEFATGHTERLRITSTGLLLGASDAQGNTTLGGNAGDSFSSTAPIQNTLIGKNAGTAITEGDQNVAVGYNALKTLTTNGSCVAIGAYALEDNLAGGNTAVGYNVLKENSTGQNNTAMGQDALVNNIGNLNIAIGRDAMKASNHNAGHDNVVLGSYAATGARHMYRNVIIGRSAIDQTTSNDSIHNNVIIGYEAGRRLSHYIAHNVILGAHAMDGGGTGGGLANQYNISDNIAIGRYALQNAKISTNNNIVIGQEAAQNAATGSGTYSYWSHNIAIGYRCLRDCTGGPDAMVAVGQNALEYHTGDGDASSGGYTVAFGGGAFRNNRHVRHSVAVGNNAGTDWNPAKGAMHEGGCTFIGGGAGRQHSTGTSNIAIGRDSLNNVVTGTNNTAIGNRCFERITSGSNNCAVTGLYGGLFVSTGDYNNFFGSLAGYAYDTNNATATGDHNNIYGGYSKSSANNNDHENIFGGGLTGKGANTTFIKGAVYNSNNSSSFSTTSDERIKKNIVDNNTGLDAIEKIRVRNFEYRTKNEITDFDNPEAVVVKDKSGVQVGVIAQEIKDILPDVVKQNTTGAYTVDPDNLTWYLVNAVKELSAEVKSLKAQINS